MTTNREDQIELADGDADDDGNDGHASTGGAAVAGAVTGGVVAGTAVGGIVGAAAGPVGIAAGAAAGAAVGAVVERAIHGSAGPEHYEGDHEHTGDDDGHDHEAHQQLNRTEDRDTTRVPVREEELVASTRPVQTGEVEVRKDVVEERQTVNVPTEREEVHVERRPVNRPADGPVGTDDSTIRVPVHAEQVEVSKQPVVREEVEISKTAVSEDQPVSETVRREEVHVGGDRDRPTDGPLRRN